MIRSINIKNIQSHKDTTLEFSPGINAIVGSSNNGKSAVLRALYWAVYNRPLGTDTLLSHWATDKKGNQIAPMSVTVENDNGTVTRRRTKTENQYIVNDEELNVVKTDVPTQVEELLRLSDTNIQKQQDAPFLLSLTSGQVAQYFNKTVRLDVIDKVLSNAESKRRKTMNDIKQAEELLAEFENKKEKYSWLNAVEKLLVKYDNITSKVEQNRQQIETLRQQVEEFDKCKKITAKLNSIVAVKKTVAELQKQQQALEEITARKNILTNELQKMEECRNAVYSDFKKEKTIIQKILAFDVESIKQERIKLQEQLEDFEDCRNTMQAKKKEAVELKKQLPDICPLCGAVMKNGVCYEKNER